MRLLLLALFAVSLDAFAADGFAGAENFDDFAPAYSEDLTHVEESFLYFERSELATVATGVDSFTGPLGSGMSAALPVLDLRFAHFFDFRRAVELRLNNSRFTGSMDGDTLGALGLTTIQNSLTANNNFFELGFFRLGAGFKYYAANDAPENWGIDDRTVWSPNYFFTLGLNYARFGISMPSARKEESVDMIVPHFGVGTDFFLRTPGPGAVKRPPTISVEAGYTFIGSWLPIVGFQNTSGNPSIGDMLSARVGANFAF